MTEKSSIPFGARIFFTIMSVDGADAPTLVKSLSTVPRGGARPLRPGSRTSARPVGQRGGSRGRLSDMSASLCDQCLWDLNLFAARRSIQLVRADRPETRRVSR